MPLTVAPEQAVIVEAGVRVVSVGLGEEGVLIYQLRCILRVQMLSSAVDVGGHRRWFARGAIEWDMGLVGASEVSATETSTRASATRGTIVLAGRGVTQRSPNGTLRNGRVERREPESSARRGADRKSVV